MLIILDLSQQIVLTILESITDLNLFTSEQITTFKYEKNISVLLNTVTMAHLRYLNKSRTPAFPRRRQAIHSAVLLSASYVAC